MLDKNLMVKVTNRDNGTVGYTIPDLGNLHRTFQSGETKEISMDELRKLSYIPGGNQILKNYLVIENEDAVNELLNEVEPEYYYSEEDVKKLLLQGTLDQFEDCLNFAPEGIINLVKKLAVDLKLNDVAKRQMLLEKTGFNVTSAININEATMEDDAAPVKTRKAAAITETVKEESSPVRKSTTIATGKYKVVSK